MKLVNPADAELNAVFAFEVAGWKECDPALGRFLVDPKDGLIRNPPPFTTSFEAVLPWLEKSPLDVVMTYSQTCCLWTVELLGRFTSNKSFKGESEEGPAKAAVIALLRAHGVEVEFVK